MKKYFSLLFILLSSFSYANINAIVSILPQKTFLEEIGGNLVNVSVMVQAGDSPHSYEPKPSQMVDITKADVYFAIGVEFENVWLKKFQNQNNSLLMVDLAKDISKIDIKQHGHSHGHKEDKHDEEAKDPHIWTSPSNIKTIAKNILNTLVSIDKKNEQTYQQNYSHFIAKIDHTDATIKDVLRNTPKHTKFMVFHPSWGYFAKEYNLEQFPIEVEGKEPKPRELAYIIKEAREENIKAIFTQPEFSDKSAKIIANELKVKVIKVSPLNPDWAKNLIDIAKAISQ
jgi:zinc transport system substrate-binding protein